LGGGYVRNIYTTSGTYTKPAGVKAIKVTVIGGGGGGSGAPSGVTGAGGTAGGYAEEVIQGPAITPTVPISIGSGGTPGPGSSGTKGGNGGTTSFGGYVSATGGTGGGPGPVTGNGGQGLGGDINKTGDNHATTKGLFFPLAATVATRMGCSTPMGKGGLIELATLPTWPTNSGASKPAALLTGDGYGSGGGGGIGPSVGGDGRPGVVIVEEFY